MSKITAREGVCIYSQSVVGTVPNNGEPAWPSGKATKAGKRNDAGSTRSLLSPDITVMVDWTLQINYQSIYLQAKTEMSGTVKKINCVLALI